MEKAIDAYRTISEVAEDLDLPQHVLRFWETRFAQIKPLKRGGGRRYYRPEDVDLLKGIRHLLYGEGFTIRGVQRILKDQGPRAVIALGRGEGAEAAAKPDGPEVVDRKSPPPPEAAEGRPQPVPRPAPAFLETSVVPLPPKNAPRIEPLPPVAVPSPPAGIRMIPREAEPSTEIAVPGPARPHPMPIRPQSVPYGVQTATRPRPVETGEEPGFSMPRPAAGLSREEVRLLQATLYELTECKRLLDAALAERAENA